MSLAKTPKIATNELSMEDVRLPPCDLWSDEPPLESDLHRDQIELLLACLKWWWQDRTDFYASGNLTIYFSEEHITTRDFRGPDFFVALDSDPHPRRSWMVWVEQGKYPNVIVELLSDSTAKVDRGFKKKLYQDTFRTPEYFWFYPETLEFKGFHLMSGQYRAIKPNAQGWLWSQQLELFLGIHESQLRFFTADGHLVSSPKETVRQEQRQRELAQQQAEQERQQRELAQQQAEQERQQRELAQQQVEALKARLRELGVDSELPE
ncbi:MAG: Uma2 family endonuclease [Leptolyngbyaceae cyanobacterium RU_5_1]|nr:Uma2 family endonuclease [Leptolyngbyaceae cyanobacterium RU_5_1]